MLRWWRSLFAWQTVMRLGVYAYEQNEVTGARRAVRLTTGCHSPIDQIWLDTGERSKPSRPPSPAPLRST